MKRYPIYLLDADETLFDFRRAEREALRRVLERRGVPFTEELLLRYREINEGLWRALERGEIQKDFLEVERFSRFLGELGLPDDPAAVGTEEYPAELARGSDLLPGALEVCRALAETSALYLVTNGITRVQKARLRESPLAPLIAGIFVSEEAGAAKPSPAYFDYVFARIGEDRRRDCLIVGDSLTSDMAGGIAVGIDTCWYNPARRALPPGMRVTFRISSLEQLLE